MSFAIFWIILGDIDRKNFFKKSNIMFIVFFSDALEHITWKKIKNSEDQG